MHDLVAGSTARVVEEAGHMPTLERPEAVTEAIGTWLYA
jgi:pimeloyl-ACP methyl ester carboxylesterase